MVRLKKFLFREKYALGAFGITLLSLFIYAIAAEIAPFGKNALLSMDLHGQYYPMMMQKLRDFFSVWSWNGSLGFSSAAQSAYYTNSIFLLLMAPFSGYARVCALDLMIFFKISLSAAFFVYYLEKKFERYDVFSMVFGVAYGLSAYLTAYILQPMWLDVVLLLPLILVALDRLTEGRSPIPYILLLALAIFSNFYISWAVCIFLVLWFVVSLIEGKKRSFRNLFHTTAVFGLSSLAAGMLCAVTLFPLISHMDHWISSSIGFDEPAEWYHEISEIVDSFSFGLRSSWEFGPANVFCGSAVLFFAVAFILNKEISIRKRIAFTSLAVLLFVSFEFNVLDFIWHGLHFPNQLPGRQSFLFIFLILLMSYETVVFRNGLTVPRLLFSFWAAFGFFFIGLQKSKNAEGRFVSVLIVAAVFVFLIIMTAMKNKESLIRFANCALVFVLLADVCVNGIYVLCRYSRISDGALYAKEAGLLETYTEKYESGKKDFYRTETVSNFTFNPGQIYGMKGISYYSSTMNGNIYHLLERLGNRVYAKNVSSVYIPTPLQDMMFGVRYYYMRGSRSLSYGKVLEKDGSLSVYESPYALPVAYAVDYDILNIEKTKKTGIDLQERFLRLASGSSSRLIRENEYMDMTVSNGTIRGDYIYAKDAESEVTYTVEFEVAEKGYFFLDSDFTVGNYEIHVNGLKMRTGACGADTLIDVGYLYEGNTVSVTVRVKGYSVILFGMRAYTMPKKDLEATYNKLSEQGLQVESASDTKIKGTVTVKEDGVLYASIPAENGWEVYIDGEKQKTYDLGMGLLFCDIQAGTHTVEYRYRAPGLALGLTVSAVTALGIAAFGIFVYGKKLKKKAAESTDETN
ncbi:MAG: hypothetical protein E7603_02695 [Ruminococcaceae bacterium]|nr:hypothetical protein [Oscillospiraceae bacterium]